jgi:hypothetical protein
MPATKQKKTAGASHTRVREVANDGRPSPGKRADAGRDPLESGADTTVATGPAQDAVLLLQSEHRTVAALFDKAARQPGAASLIARELERHARLEEEIFYPAVAATSEGADAIRQAKAQHGDIRSAMRGDLAALRAAVERHVEFEETVVFAAAQRALDKGALVALAERMEQRNRELGGTLPLATPRRGKGTTTA